MIKIASVLVATDFGPASDSALNYGREFARTFGATLHVLHVIENPLVSAITEAAAADLDRMQAALESGAEEQLARVLTQEDRSQLGAVAAVRSGRSPAFEIMEYAKDTGVNLIIVGTHGRGAMGHLLMGSVAEKVVRIAPCPVLTVRSPEREFILPDALQAVETSRSRR